MPNYGSLLKTKATVYDLLAVTQTGVRDSKPELAALQGAGKMMITRVIVRKIREKLEDIAGKRHPAETGESGRIVINGRSLGAGRDRSAAHAVGDGAW